MRIVQRLTQGLTDLDVEAEYVFLHVKDSSIKLDVAFVIALVVWKRQ